MLARQLAMHISFARAHLRQAATRYPQSLSSAATRDPLEKLPEVRNAENRPSVT